MSNRGRGYGEACSRCREKKRRCKPGTDLAACSLCEQDGVACEVTSKRASISKAQERRESSTGISPSSTTTVRPDDLLHSPHQSTAGAAAMFTSPGRWAQAGRSHSGGSVTTEIAGTSGSMTLGGPSSQPNPFVRDDHESQTVQPDERLLATYFAWQCPQLMPVDEQIFRRDMRSSPTGPYFSSLLLYALQAQASRHTIGNDGGIYGDKANALLGIALTDPPTIPTIQALLVMSGRDLALGNASAGWLKSGMAFRMIDDLQIREEIAKGNDGNGGEAAYMRRRIFWSAFAWDKFFALTLGRRPAFSLLTDHLNELPPTFASQPFWYPYHPDETFPAYTPQPSLEGEAFFASCLVYQDIERIINRLYQHHHQTSDFDEDRKFVALTSGRLLEWRRRVPHVLLDTAYLPSVSPPPHILTVNILYRVAWILLHRPLRSRSTSLAEAHDARQICMTRSAEINLLFDLHERTFNLRNITYLLAYMAYVTATIDVDEAMSGETSRSVPAKQRLELTLRVLTQASQHTPGIQRSINHLRQKLAHRPDRSILSGQASGTTTPTTAHPSANAAQGQLAEGVHLAANEGVFGDQVNGLAGLDLGFEELFASLLPEFSVDNTMGWGDLGMNSMAPLPPGELDWMWS